MSQILLIEDNAGDILAIRKVISELTPATKVSVAIDGEQAIRILADPGFKADLIILDLNIPKVPGIAVLARCKPAAPVVIFSSSSNPAEIERAKELGVREFVRKPIDFDEFSNVVTRVVREWIEPSASGAAGGQTD
ncbi:MAG TPA: response regulator [Bryobacteraceae bacterium]|nr:response regulator [Bryobacteraceae bacterium]